jgi:hypothetical protein
MKSFDETQPAIFFYLHLLLVLRNSGTLLRNANKRSPFPHAFAISPHPSNGSWKNMYLHMSKDMCVDVTSTEVSLDDLDVHSLAVAIVSVDSQKRYEIYRNMTLIE